MSHNVRLTDGTTTLQLSESDQLLLEYVPAANPIDGLVDETMRIEFRGSTPLTNIRTVQTLFEQVTRWESGKVATPVYVEIDLGATGTYYRARLHSASMVFDQDTLGAHFAGQAFQASLNWKREIWEGPETELPLASGGSKTTGGVSIYVHNDATHRDYVDIAGVDVAGDSPAPVRIRMTHTSSTAGRMKNIYVFHNVDSTPSTFAHTLQGEDATGGSDVSNAGSSNGYYNNSTWTATTETKLLEWTLSTALLEAAKAGRFAIGLRFRNTPGYSDLYVRFKIMTTSPYYPIWVGDLALIKNELYQIIDVVNLPPYLPRQTSYLPLAFEIYGWRNQSGTHAMQIDYVNLMPLSTTSGMNHWDTVARGVAQNEFFNHDGIQDLNYREDATPQKIGEFVSYGGGIKIVPGANQRLIVASFGDSATDPLGQTWSVRAYYRPRRVSL